MKSLCLCLLLALAASWANAQDLEFRPPQNAADPAAVAVMRDLAVRILPVYQEKDPERYLSNLSALQMVAGDYPSANATRASLRDRRRTSGAGRPADRAVLYDIYARAKAIQANDRVPFQQAFTQSYRDTVPKLGDLDAFRVMNWFGTPLSTLQDTLQRSFDQWRARGNIPLAQAVDLVWTFLSFEASRSFSPLVGALDAEEDQRRYITDEGVAIRTPDGATLSAILVRPRRNGKLPTLLEFSHFDSANLAREVAAHGYVAVVAHARGVRGSSGRFVPFQHDGEDARTVINWIAKQAWSDARVGMYGFSYSGFTAWAAAKRLPEALKAIATSDRTAPGVDSPMAGNIFRNSAYRWAYMVMNAEAPDNKLFTDDAQWRAFNRDWYKSGRRYREFATPTGRHSTVFRGWLNHPSYDRFWQKMIPFAEDFAKVNIPVLTTTGYYSEGQLGAMYYFTQHMKHHPRANHTLLVGPYDEASIQRGAAPVLRGYTLDPAAVVELRELRYQWFDWALRGGARPALLRDRVNFQVMGGNEWRHVPSLAAMGRNTLRYYLQENLAGDINQLASAKAAQVTFLPQTFDLADRSDADWTPPSEIVSRQLKPHNGELFTSEPLAQPVEIGGQVSARLDFSVNRQDLDLNLALYEQLPSGEYLKLSETYEVRASYVKDRVRRQLLKAGVRQQLTVKSERLTSRRVQAGSRIVIVLGINKRPDRQINYGTGDDVSEESIEDAAVPLRVRWYNTSYIDIPVTTLKIVAPSTAR